MYRRIRELEEALEGARAEALDKDRKIEAQRQKLENFKGRLDREKSDTVSLQIDVERRQAEIASMSE